MGSRGINTPDNSLDLVTRGAYTMESKSIRLNSIWSKPDNPHATCGVAELQREVRKRGWEDITPADVEDYLASKRAYTLHKVARKTFPRQRVLAPAPRVIMGADIWLICQN